MIKPANQGVLDNQFALDVNSVKQLQQVAKGSPNQALSIAAKEFESIFIQMMLKSMRDATFKSELFKSHENDFYTSMFDQQISKSLAQKGMGFADLMVKQLTQNQTDHQQNLIDQQMSAEVLSKYQNDRINDSGLPFALINPEHYSEHHQQSETAAKNKASLSGNINQFIDELLDHAVNFGKQTGLPAGYALAHAALESGWGKSVPQYADGKTSFNLFGIKANKDWSGKVVEVVTTEYTNGIATKVVDRFKAYDSYTEAFTDYAKILTHNDRYAKVIQNGKTPWEFAKHLQLSGYATDPNYADKLFNVMKRLGFS
jgi:flagellar protein FlgJ